MQQTRRARGPVLCWCWWAPVQATGGAGQHGAPSGAHWLCLVLGAAGRGLAACSPPPPTCYTCAPTTAPCLEHKARSWLVLPGMLQRLLLSPLGCVAGYRYVGQLLGSWFHRARHAGAAGGGFIAVVEVVAHGLSGSGGWQHAGRVSSPTTSVVFLPPPPPSPRVVVYVSQPPRHQVDSVNAIHL